MDTPYQWTKQVASHWGGTRNGTIVHWPNGIKEKGRHAHQFTPRHRSRADGAGGGRAPRADSRQRRAAEPLRGHEHAYSFDDADAPERAQTQYFEMFVQPRHLPQGLERGDEAPNPWAMAATMPAFDDDVWELYDGHDWTQSKDLSDEMPESCMSCSACSCEAVKYNVLPLDDRRIERLRPTWPGDQNS